MKPTPVEMRPPKAPVYQYTLPLGDESNLPATVIEAEKNAILVALTLGGYQKQRYIRHPGLGISKIPAITGRGLQETSFGDSKKYSANDEAFIGRHCGGAAGDDTP